MNHNFEAWLGQNAPIEIASPLFQNTKTIIDFKVLNKDRSNFDLTGKNAKFIFQSIDDEVEILKSACIIIDAVAGELITTIESAALSKTKECLGELVIWLVADINKIITHRIPFVFHVAKTLVIDGKD